MVVPGELLFADGGVPILEGRAVVEVGVVNTGDRPVQVGSHFHFAEANPALAFDRAAAEVFRLDIPAGTSVRFEPGMSLAVPLVRLAGAQVVRGLRHD